MFLRYAELGPQGVPIEVPPPVQTTVPTSSRIH
jgi:hypothetical protein